MKLQENTLFYNRYHLIKLLGRGGFSEVWLAEDNKTNLRVALKVYAPGTGLDADGIKLFSQEFSLVFDMNHSNLLKPTHYDIYEQMPFLVMPFCPQGSASKLVGKITEEEAWRFLSDVSAGLAYLHSKEPPVIHQDIKADNVLIDTQGAFLITDFGISTKARSTLRKSVVNSHTSGSGTLAYMGPERFSKDNIPIKASDVWALGATMCELLTGYVPFGENGGLIQKSGAEIPDIGGKWSSDLKKIIGFCLQQEPWDRPTAETVHKWAQQHLNGVKVSWSGAKTKSNSNSKYRWKWIAGIAAALLIAIISVVALQNKKPKPDINQNIDTNINNSVNSSEGKKVDVKDKSYDLNGKKFIYTGETLNGLPHGTGEARYTANVQDDVEDGSIYKGEFYQGYREGKGRIQNPSGSLYEGEYLHDKANGHGKYTFSDGVYYEGDFVNNMFHGKGTEYTAAGKIIRQGIYENDKFIKK